MQTNNVSTERNSCNSYLTTDIFISVLCVNKDVKFL